MQDVRLSGVRARGGSDAEGEKRDEAHDRAPASHEGSLTAHGHARESASRGAALPNVIGAPATIPPGPVGGRVDLERLRAGKAPSVV